MRLARSEDPGKWDTFWKDSVLNAAILLMFGQYCMNLKPESTADSEVFEEMKQEEFMEMLKGGEFTLTSINYTQWKTVLLTCRKDSGEVVLKKVAFTDHVDFYQSLKSCIPSSKAAGSTLVVQGQIELVKVFSIITLITGGLHFWQYFRLKKTLLPQTSQEIVRSFLKIPTSFGVIMLGAFYYVCTSESFPGTQKFLKDSLHVGPLEAIELLLNPFHIEMEDVKELLKAGKVWKVFYSESKGVYVIYTKGGLHDEWERTNFTIVDFENDTDWEVEYLRKLKDHQGHPSSEYVDFQSVSAAQLAWKLVQGVLRSDGCSGQCETPVFEESLE
jgi:hypothetical protein